ncbi:MAG TPA: HAMP domain-containing sensor histidine kinase [Sphaerochaeta sp.]|nr:HAMP domain-containing sensor histidine kinase [Sphaerochaeta sp.]
MNTKKPRQFFNRLSARSLALVLVSLGIFALVLALLLTFGLGEIMRVWHEDEQSALHLYVADTLVALQKEAAAKGSNVAQSDLVRAFEGLPFAPDYLVVTKADGSLLYYYKQAERGTGQTRMALRNLKDIQQWNDVSLDDGSLAFRYALHLPAFDESESNGFLIATSKLLLLWALVTAALLSLFLAYLFTRPLKRESKSVVRSLQRMADGERGVPPQLGKVAEFNDIVHASQVLQDHLVVEEQLRRQWAEDIAHDLRTPLSVLRAQLEAMVDGVFKMEPSRLEKLVLETEKLEALVNSLALLTHLETPGFSPRQQDVKLNVFLQSLTEQYSQPARNKNMRLKVDCPETVILSCDPSLTERALGNLLANAIKYGKGGAPIHLVVVAKETGRALSLCIENEGVISEEVLRHMFDRLYRGEEARSTKGAGLGLSIVKAIVEAHRWEIAVSSESSTKVLIQFTKSLP